MSPTNIRTRNTLALYQAFVEAQVNMGESPTGMARAFALHLEISASRWSQIKGGQTIGNKMANQIEAKCGKPPGWLDQVVFPEGQIYFSSEHAFLEICKLAWRKAEKTKSQTALAYLIREWI